MKKKDNDAFLKSITGVSPIIKKGTLEKPIPKTIKFSTKDILKDVEKTKHDQEKESTAKKSVYRVEKTNLNKKLKKGRIPIDKKIDFHGMSVSEAESLFIKTISRCYENRSRCLLFVTGKGILKKQKDNQHDSKLYYGKIRNNFLAWTQQKEVAKYILSVEQAGIEHGADGAFFVYLRKYKT